VSATTAALNDGRCNSDVLPASNDSSFPLARIAVPGVPCEPGATDGGGDRVDRASRFGLLA